MFSCASAVEPPMCGVRITLSNLRNGEINSSLMDAGSSGNTSIAAPRILPSSNALANASMSTTVPRAALIKMAPCFNWAIRSALIKLRVDGNSGTCREMTSQEPSNSSKLRTCLALPRGSLFSMS